MSYDKSCSPDEVPTDYGQAALYWFDRGSSIIPVLPGTKRTAVMWDPWNSGLSRERILAYWKQHPDHEVGCIVGDKLIVFDADTEQAEAALAQLEEAFDVTPAMVMGTAKGCHHYYRRAPGIYAKSDSHSTEEHPERIDVKTGRAMVVLAPSTGKELVYMDVDHVDDLPDVGQDFIDAVFHHNGRQAPRPPEVRPAIKPSDDDDLIIGTLESVLGQPDPDESYEDWMSIGMAIHHETGGSEAGFGAWDQWSSRGAKYPGSAALRTKWESFGRYTGTPVTAGTINNIVAERAERQVATETFPTCGAEVFQGTDSPERVPQAHPLARYSMQDRVDELRREVSRQVFLLGQVALMAQYTIFYAAPNTGKTLLVLRMLIEAIRAKRIDPQCVFYVNVDDNLEGLTVKAELAARYGFHMIAPGYNGFESANLKSVIPDVIESGQAKGTVLILDTVKKFTNMMDKTNSSSFNTLIRKFILKGGTCIALAHTNKKKNEQGKSVYAGTSDMVDDADCAYILELVSLDEDTQTKTVAFENEKQRGHVLDRAAYRYSTVRGQSYAELLDSVESLDDGDLEAVKETESAKVSQPVVEAILGCLKDGIETKMAIVKEAANRAHVSQRVVTQVLELHTGDHSPGHKWSCTVGARGAKIYRLLPA
ncbi:PriCT-2 domain-containing protein [Thiocapsa marina]|uniref:Primase 2 n=1 Tax=Thiocapsa marina 5811 TaxID=768671 RepID=F9UHN3_9GAMM|nr:PriCT-2 domain-containing protein [Thiocapsa marina]EGV16342.1 Primase 2 [Thiocapsa marina 5811]